MQTVPSIAADRKVLAALMSLGATLFPVAVSLDDRGRCLKTPRVREWQKSARHAIDRPSMLGTEAAYGFHPETIGAVVIDLDKKGDKDGEAELSKLCPCPEITDPQVYVDSPNGRHLYFSRRGLPLAVLQSRNSVLPGVDLRGHHSGGWLVAPGSVGWSLAREEWRRYELEGDLAALPQMPQELIETLCRLLSTTEKTEADTFPDFIAPPSSGEILPKSEIDPRVGELFRLASDLARSPPLFDRVVEALVPKAVRLNGDWVTGDYSGNPGNSCKWSPRTGIIKDFADPSKGGDLIWWLSTHKGMSTIEAARKILTFAGAADPTGQESIENVRKEAAVLAAAGTAPVTGEYPLTDSGNGERLAAAIDGRLRYNASSRVWMAWNGQVWKRDEEGASAQQLAIKIIRGIAAEVAETQDDALAKKKAAWAIRSESMERRNAMVKAASYMPGIITTEDQFDLEYDHLNTLSGIVDLRTGKVENPDPDRMHSQQCPYPVDYNAPSRWLTFVAETFEFDDSLIEWIHQYLGYCLTGRTSDQVFPIWWGGGQNGKSVMLNVVGALMGDYCKKAAAESWLSRPASQPVRDDIAALRGARFVWASEPESNRSLATAMVKELTGGDPVTCRHLYGRPFTYTPTFKTAFVTNHRPHVKSQDFGIWRRLRFVPFTFRVPEARKIPDLTAILLEEEGPRILGWMIEGAKKWYAAGHLPECQKIAMATADLKEGDDILAEFILESCDLGAGKEVRYDNLWNAYRSWNENKGIKLYCGRTTFRALVLERNGLAPRKHHTTWYVTGLALKPEAEAPAHKHWND